MVFVTWETAPCITVAASIPGKLLPPCAPVWAGFRPMRVMVSSIRFATFTMLKISTIQGNTSRPLGMADMTDSSILKKITLDRKSVV